MNYASVCSGVEAASLAWEALGWKPVWFSEIEPFPSAVLAHHWPEVPNLGDMTKIDGEKYHGTIDLLVGGTPCQSFSVAGKRRGLSDDRGGLMLHFVRLAYETGARWVLWENVPGCLSQAHGRAFATLLSCLAGYDVEIPEKGWRNSGVVTNYPGCYAVAWRVLDAQYTRVDGYPLAIPQRRRRVFVVGCLDNWRRAAEVLFEPKGLLGDTPPRRKAGQGVARSLTAGVGGASGAECLTPWETQANRVFTTDGAFPTLPSQSDSGMNRQAILNCGKRTDVCEADVTTYPLNSMVFGKELSDNDRQTLGVGGETDPCPTIQAQHHHAVAIAESVHAEVLHFTVRRLLPVECERLMGFPDGHTQIPWRGKPAEQCPDAPRYKACGNSMAINVMRWIGMRIQMMEEMI